MGYKSLLRNRQWYDFSKLVKTRDKLSCLVCGRKEGEVTLQVHHNQYIEGLAPWDYPISSCVTLCSGCHAREHGLLQPNRGWTLLEINDLGDVYGCCEREGCKNEIRYEHVTYHPNWGYLKVGSTCINHLTQEDRALSEDALKIYKQATKFLAEAIWTRAYTEERKSHQYCTYKGHQVIICGSDITAFVIQLAIKQKSKKRYSYTSKIRVRIKQIERVKELGYIWLRGYLANDKQEKIILRNLYQTLLNS